MQLLKSIKDKFNALGTKEYTFENGGKTATVTTKDMLIATSYTVKTNDNAGSTGEEHMFSVGRNVTAQGVQKGKDFCGIT